MNLKQILGNDYDVTISIVECFNCKKRKFYGCTSELNELYFIEKTSKCCDNPNPFFIE